MRFITRNTLVGAGLVLVIGGASAGAVVFNRDDGATTSSVTAPTKASTTTSTSTSTTTSTTTTTTTTAPPAPEPAPAPAPTQQAGPSQGASSAPAPQPEPEPAPAPPPPAPVCSGGAGGIGGAVLGAMNGSRGGGLCWNSQLAGFAQGWANWMAANNSLTHQNLNSLISQTSFMTMGENLLVGPAGMSVDQMEQAWMNSAGHRANILNGAFSAAGVGVATDGQGQIWVAVEFGG